MTELLELTIDLLSSSGIGNVVLCGRLCVVMWLFGNPTSQI